MTLTLQPITIDNWIDCISLTPTKEQVRSRFVAPNTLSLAQAHYEPWWQPYGGYRMETTVGSSQAAKVAGMTIRPVQSADAAEWLRMRVALWPDDPEKEAAEIATFLSTIPHTKLEEMHEAFVCERPDGRLCGLVEVSLHSSAPGCETDHIGYLEAWYVDPDWRNKGVGRALVELAEAWARAEGCVEMASDTVPFYPLSPAAHAALGYEVVEWSFRKELLS